MSEFSHLVEEIPEVVRQEERYTLVITDGYATAEEREFFSAVPIVNPYAINLKQYIPNMPMNLEEFIETLSAVVEDAQDRAGTVESERVKVVQEYNPEHFPELGDEVITVNILSRSPGKMNVKGDGRPVRKPILYDEYSDPRSPNKVFCVLSRPIDHTLEITPWAKTSTLANSRALWLERLLVSHSWAFTSKGAERFHWEGRSRDTLWTHAGARLHQRPMKFFLRLREYNVVAESTIRDFQLELSSNT